jgi:TonB family protein
LAWHNHWGGDMRRFFRSDSVSLVLFAWALVSGFTSLAFCDLSVRADDSRSDSGSSNAKSAPVQEKSVQEKSPDMTAYMAAVTKKIQNIWRSPDVQRNCTVSILFSVDKNGGLTSNVVKKSSGFPKVDQLALQAIKKAAPFAKLPDGTGKFSVDYGFQCGPHKSADAYLFNGVPIKNQEYKVSSGGATLHNLDTDSPAERKLQQRASALQDKANSLEFRLVELQHASPVDNSKVASVTLDLANVYKQLQQYEKAESLYKSVVALEEKLDDRTAFSKALFEFANMYYVMGKYVDAEPLYERSVSMQDAQHSDKQVLSEYAKTLYKLNKTAKADDIYKQLRGM